MHGVPMLVGDDLKLDVVRIDDQFLDVNGAVSKSLFRFGPRRMKRRGETGLVVRRSHSAAAAARDRLDHDGKTDPARDFQRLLFVLDDPVAPGRDGYPRFARIGARGILVAHRVHRARRRADEFDFAAFAHLGEVRVLRQETVAGMDRIHVAHFRRAHDAIDLQITFRARRRADADRFVRELDVERIDIRLRIDREGADAQLLASANDAQRDFAPVRD